MIDFFILGSGIAGSTIANLLSKSYTVEIFDKARGPGGRASNKRFKSKLSFDHGAQYFSAESKQFKEFIHKLYKKNILKIWNGNHLDFVFKKKVNSLKYIGVKSNNSICKHLLKNIKQNYSSKITKIIRKKNYWEITVNDKKKYHSKALILTCPYPQLKKIAKNYLNKKMLNLKITMSPNITAMLALGNQNIRNISSIRFNDNILTWAANENSKKRFKSNTNLWTLQASSKWSKKYINYSKKNNKVLNLLISKFLEFMDLKKNQIIHKKIHGWKYSYNYNKTSLKNYWNNKYSLGVCGDWFLGPKAENAWQSAGELYKRIKKNPLKNKGV